MTNKFEIPQANPDQARQERIDSLVSMAKNLEAARSEGMSEIVKGFAKELRELAGGPRQFEEFMNTRFDRKSDWLIWDSLKKGAEQADISKDLALSPETAHLVQEAQELFIRAQELRDAATTDGGDQSFYRPTQDQAQESSRIKERFTAIGGRLRAEDPENASSIIANYFGHTWAAEYLQKGL